MSGLVASVAGFAMAVALGVGGFIAVTVSKKPPPKASVTLILALPIEHYDVKSHEDYKQEKHKLLRL
jgi:hypothetical protein